MKTKKAFITGIAGQDGSYLSESLLNLGYQVEGVVKDIQRIDNLKKIKNKIKISEVDLVDLRKLKSTILEAKPDQIYNLGGIATLTAFKNNPDYANRVTEAAARTVIETAMLLYKAGYKIKIFQASSCLIFGSPKVYPQDESTNFNPTTPYARAKLNVDMYVRELRDKQKLHISCGILYNHESPRRPLEYVTRKITAAAACIYNKVKKIPKDAFGQPILTDDFKLSIENIDAKRDWGDARDFIRAYFLMLEQNVPEDYIVATGKIHNIVEILDIAFGFLGLSWHNYISRGSTTFKSQDTNLLCGNAIKARTKLNWVPQIKFEDTIEDMVENDVKIFST